MTKDTDGSRHIFDLIDGGVAANNPVQAHFEFIVHLNDKCYFFCIISPGIFPLPPNKLKHGANIIDSGIQVKPDRIGFNWSSKVGHATYIRQLHLWNNKSGELASLANFTFVIDSNKNESYADGLTFFLAQNNSVIIPGGAMGLPTDAITTASINQFVAVEFDTYWNGWDPVNSNLTSMGDHVGISINFVESVKAQKWFKNINDGG
nr:L-type lectin-domain containing receptor kinase IX.1-like [Tanacetum cinerariifolium]